MRPVELVPAAVLDAFGCEGTPVALLGGAGTSVRVGQAVLKPVEDEVEAAWTADLLSRLPQDGFRVAVPVRARSGAWVANGWSASTHVAGEAGPAGRWGELLSAADAFHTALRDEPRPAFLSRRTHRWAVADRVAWGETSTDALPPVAPLLRRLTPLLASSTGDEPAQVVHGDLAGNVLFAPGLPPAVLDVSPYWRPRSHAEAVVAVDRLLWFDRSDALVRQVAADHGPAAPARALVFRLVALDERARDDRSALEELPLFEHAVSVLEGRG